MQTAYMQKTLARANVGEGVLVWAPVSITKPENLIIGRGVFIAANFQAFCGGGIEICEGAGLSRNVCIYSADHDFMEPDTLPYGTRFKLGKVTIGRGAFVGLNTVILPGVTIGEGAVVGANSVVAVDVAPLAVAAGNPVRVIRYRDRETFDRLIRCKHKRISDVRGYRMSDRKLLALVKKHYPAVRERLRAGGEFTFGPDSGVEEKLRSHILYFISKYDPEIEFIETGDGYSLRLCDFPGAPG